MASAGEQVEALARLLLGFCLGQNAAAHNHHTVGRQHQRSGMPFGNSVKLGPGHAQRIGTRQLARPRRFVDVGRVDRGRLQTDLSQKVEPARRRGGEHERDHARILLDATPR